MWSSLPQPTSNHIKCKYCSIWLLPSSMDDHKNIHTKTKIYPCSDCQKIFHHQNSKNKHHQFQHQIRDITCSICKSSFQSTMQEFKMHQRLFHDGKKCAVVKPLARGRRKNPVKVRRSNEALNEPSVCFIKMEPNSKEEIEEEVEEGPHLDPFGTIIKSEPIMDEEDESEPTDELEFKGEYSSSPEPSMEVSKIEKTEYGAMNLPNFPTTDMEFQCNLCSRGFSNEKSLKKHRGNMQCIGRQRRLQDECSTFFYSCKYCSRTYKRYWKYHAHSKSHTTQQQTYICAHCSITYHHRGTFRLHFLKLHSTEPQTCKFCAASLPGVEALKHHLKAAHPAPDTKAKRWIYFKEEGSPLVCGYCTEEVTFPTFEALQQHSDVVHHREFACWMCSRAFKARGALDEHVQVQHLKRRLICDLCGKVCGSKLSFRDHWVCHFDVKPYECGACGAKFKRQRALKKHRDRFHGVNPVPLGKRGRKKKDS